MSEPRATTRVGRGAAWTLIYLAAVRLATLGQSVAVARRLGEAGAGEFGVALNVSAFAAFLAAMNVPPVLARTLAREGDPAVRARLVRASGTMLAVSGVVAAIVLGSIAGPLALYAYRDRALVDVLRWTGPLALATGLVVWSEHIFHGLRRFDRLAWWGIAFCALDLGLGLAVVDRGVPALQATRTIARLIALPLAWIWWRGGVRPIQPAADAPAAHTIQDPGDLARLRAILGLAGPAFLSSVLLSLGQTLLRMLLVRHSGLAVAGMFQVADSLAQGLQLIPGAAAIAFLPSIASDLAREKPTVGQSLARAFARVTGFNLPLALGLGALAPLALGLVFGASYRPAAATLTWLCFAYGAMGLCTLLQVFAMARGDLWPTVAFQALWMAAMLAAYGLTIEHGAPAAAIALAAGYLVMLVGLLATLSRRWSVSIAPLLPIVGLNVASLLAFALLYQVPGIPPPVPAVAALLLAGFVFVRWGIPGLREQVSESPGGAA